MNCINTLLSVPESPMEEVTNAMYDKTRKFAMTHDIQLKLPQMMFDGAILRISPRSFEGNGALVKIELEPDTRSVQESHGSPRFILKKISKLTHQLQMRRWRRKWPSH